ncbi:hypothetical protein [Phenylobacterium zucineum]|uniref:hypothetical protein n=1 Tax=Phenylobacterium zucineum TaxID=284016 RepID=UPI0011D12C41|nr:hypothetical protein [Phenylobacterium zucineum]
MILRPVALGAVLLLAACSSGGDSASSSDPYAGLDAQVLSWRTDIETNHPACATKVEGKGCEGFEVTCKGAQELSAEEQAQGITAQVVAAMRFSGRNADGSTGKPGSAFAEFSKTGDAWTRAETRPVNLTTCAPF